MSFQSFLKENEKNIINAWQQKVEDEFPGKYKLDELTHNAFSYLQLLIENEIPLEQHPAFEVIHSMCRYHADNGTPLEHLLHSSHLWRQTMIDMFWEYVEQDNAIDNIKPVFNLINWRIDEIQRKISSAYWQHAIMLLDEKETTITNLHRDRLNLLGKMAASMAHEIKNPLFAIGGFIELIRADLSPESLNKVKPYLDVIQLEFNNLYGHVTGFLSFSKNNVDEEPFVPCYITELVESVLNLTYPRLNNAKVDLDLQLKSVSEIKVQKQALQQVLINLISNSIEALESIQQPKRMWIKSWEDQAACYVTVSDNGVGIAEEIKHKIFDPFVTGKSNGTGIGLAICKQIMEKHHGELNFSAEAGKTSFTFFLPKIRE